MSARPLPADTTHRRCAHCGETKLLAAFAKCVSRPLGRQYTCRDCRKGYDKKRVKGLPRGPKPGQGPAVPLPAMDLMERLACIQLRKWRYPIEQTGQLVGWRITYER